MLPLFFAAPDPDLAGMPPPPSTAAPSPVEAAGFAPEVRFGGRAQLRVLADLRHDQPGEDRYESRARLDLELAARLSSTFSALVSGRLSHESRTPTWDFEMARYAAESELREAYFTVRGEGYTLDVGQQTIRWGVADANSPNDVVNPVDYREGILPDFEVPLLPVPALRITHAAPSWAAEAVYLPFFVPHRAAVYGTDWTPSGLAPQLEPLLIAARQQVGRAAEEDIQPFLLSPSPPDESPRNGSVGGRVGLRGEGVDVHLNAFYGWDRTPDLRIDPQVAELLGALQQNDLAVLLRLFPELQPRLAAGERFFDGEYHRQLVVGADLAWTLGDYTIKADVAYSPERRLYTDTFEAAPTAAVSWAGGVDFTPDADLAVTLEGHGLVPLDDAPPDRSYLFVEAWSAFAVANLRYVALEDRLTLQLSAQVDLVHDDRILLPEVTVALAETHDLTVGAIVLGGPGDSLGGLFDANDAGYVRYTASF